jgi:hypothetical protein
MPCAGALTPEEVSAIDIAGAMGPEPLLPDDEEDLGDPRWRGGVWPRGKWGVIRGLMPAMILGYFAARKLVEWAID